MYRVVLIDDEEMILRGLKHVVNWEKYQCEIVGIGDDGLEGMKVIQNTNPDMIFTDIRMPNMDGLKMLEQLKNEIKDKEVTIMTGFRDLAYAQQAIKIGVTRYLLKPSQIEEVEEALECMIRNLQEKKGESTNKDEEEYGVDNYLVQQVIDYIQLHYAEKITLAQLAEVHYVSVWHLSKLINKYCHKNFKDLLNQVRVEKAKALLLQDNSRVYEISEKVGITDITYFSRVFKKYTNMTPNTYRNHRTKTK